MQEGQAQMSRSWGLRFRRAMWFTFRCREGCGEGVRLE
jgi:hypothetical protein